jgi:hypothetical protein
VRPPRRLLACCLVAVIAPVAAGCGGSQVSPDEVPGPPPALTVPSDEGAGGSGGGSTGTDTTTDPSATSSTDGASTADAGAATDTGTDTGAAAGTAATPAPADTGGTTSTAPEATTPEPAAPASGESQQFEDFCAQNAGAC